MTTIVDAADLVNCLESADLNVVKEIRELIIENLNNNKEAWLLNGLVDSYMVSNSQKCLEILSTVREPHDKHLLDKLAEHLRGTHKLQALNILGHVVRRQPHWLHNIVRHSLLAILFKCLKTETDVPILMSGLLILTSLLPIIPVYVAPQLQEIFEVFTRLCAFNLSKPGNVPEVYLLHLQVGIYSLFHRLYAMYPCNFLTYLRSTYCRSEHKQEFEQTIQPMVERVRMHPLLITASKEKETSVERWRAKEAHDIIVECARLSLDLTEGITEESHCPVVGMHQMRTQKLCSGQKYKELRNIKKDEDTIKKPSPQTQIAELLTACKESVVSTVSAASLWSPSAVCGLSTPPPVTTTTPGGSIELQSSTSLQGTQSNTPLRTTPQMLPDSPMPGSSSSRHNSGQSVAEKRLSAISLSLSGRFSHPSDHAVTTPGDSSVPPSPLIKLDFSSSDASLFTHPLQAARRLSFPSLEEKPPQGGATAGTEASAPKQHAELCEKDGSAVPIPSPCTHSGAESAHRLAPPSDYAGGSSAPSLLQLPHLIESISAEHDDDDDDEVSELTGAGTTDPTSSDSGGNTPSSQHLTAESVQAFMKKVNRIRFNSINVTTKVYREKQPRYSRSNSCPDLEAKKVEDAAKEEASAVAVKVFASRGRSGTFGEQSQSSPDARTSLSNSTASDGMSAIESLARETTRTVTSQTSVGLKKMVDESTGDEDLSSMVDYKQYFPYEHLFPMVLPYAPLLPYHRRSAVLEGGSGPEGQHKSSQFSSLKVSESPFFTSMSPSDLLDRHIQLGGEVHAKELSHLPLPSHGSVSWTHFGGVPPADEVNILRGQVLLLHDQLMFERHRRELHAKRNRRLLGRIANTTALEETNVAMQDQLRLQEDKIQELEESLRRLQNSWQEQETNRDKLIYEKKVQEKSYMQEIESLQYRNKVLNSRLDKQTEQNSALSKEVQSCKSVLFNMQQELEAMQAKAGVSRDLQAQVERLSKELLLMGELQQKYQQRLVSMATSHQPRAEMQFILDSYKNELNNSKLSLEQKIIQLDASRARMTELEEALKTKELVIAQLKQVLEEVKSINKVELQATEEKYNAQKKIQQSLQERMLDLHNQLMRNKKPDRPLQCVADELPDQLAAEVAPRSPRGQSEVTEVTEVTEMAEEATGSE